MYIGNANVSQALKDWCRTFNIYSSLEKPVGIVEIKKKNLFMHTQI